MGGHQLKYSREGESEQPALSLVVFVSCLVLLFDKVNVKIMDVQYIRELCKIAGC